MGLWNFPPSADENSKEVRVVRQVCVFKRERDGFTSQRIPLWQAGPKTLLMRPVRETLRPS